MNNFSNIITNMDCFTVRSPDYCWMLHSICFVSFPIYSIAIIVLLRTKSTYFETYKHFLTWHTLTNFISEVYNSWFLLPVVHLPYPLLRFTGFMTQFGFSGLFQFYTINALIHQTAYSIIEMFLFRFKASLFNFKSTSFYTYLRINVYVFRITLFLFFVVNIVTYFYALDQQTISKRELLFNHPEAPWVISCDSVVVAAPFRDPITMFNLIVWMIVVFVAFTSTSSTSFYLWKYLRENEHRSPAVMRMHKMLLITLFVQTAIHGIMLGCPNLLFLYAAFFGANHEMVAQIAFYCLTTHGLVSTIAMMILTKPIKIAILQMFKCPFPRRSADVAQYSASNKI
uniref:Serpentine Receptor, class H n=2 Tax=Caenorhabditis tropicalis TaxID=1561998 RepID=A0A1I7UVN6_9PELO